MRLKKSVAISDSGFVFNAATGDSFTTNATGRFMLELLKEERETADIVEALCAEYEVEAERCEKDVRDFLSVLQQWQLVEA